MWRTWSHSTLLLVLSSNLIFKDLADLFSFCYVPVMMSKSLLDLKYPGIFNIHQQKPLKVPHLRFKGKQDNLSVLLKSVGPGPTSWWMLKATPTSTVSWTNAIT